MALRAKSLFLYGFEVTQANSSIDFRSTSGGPIKQASIAFGSYSLFGLMEAIRAALQSSDPAHIYTVQADRTFAGGTQNRVSIATNGTYLDLLFSTGPRAATSARTLIGFSATDRTGSLSYTGTSTAGTALVSEFIGYNYVPPDLMRDVFGTVNVSASGVKEALVWSVQQFTEVEFKYEPESKAIVQWTPFMTWAIQQKPFEFTREIIFPSGVDDVTLETTSASGKGLGFKMKEMLPDFPFNYQTGNLKMRIKPIS